MAFPPFEQVLPCCRSQLVLFGNAISPVHGLWVLGHALHGLELLPSDQTPRRLLANYLTMVVKQRDLSWPSPSPGVADMQVECCGHHSKGQ